MPASFPALSERESEFLKSVFPIVFAFFAMSGVIFLFEQNRDDALTYEYEFSERELLPFVQASDPDANVAGQRRGRILIWLTIQLPYVSF